MQRRALQKTLQSGSLEKLVNNVANLFSISHMAGRVAKVKKGTAPTRPRSSSSRKSLQREQKKFYFQLFVTGSTGKSALAISKVKEIFEAHLQGRYSLEIVDLYQQPHLAEGAEIVAVPTLVKRTPGPLRQLIGDLSDTKGLIQLIYGSS